MQPLVHDGVMLKKNFHFTIIDLLFLSLLSVAATWFSNIRSTKIDRQNKE